MSNPFKAIGKAFKAVVKVVKKIALPALAIGAVVLTGGAALGLLPSVGTVLGGLGLSPALVGILGTAAKGATFGAVGAALTGGNIISGATTGLVVGGAMGGLGALAGRGAQAAQAATQGAGEAVANTASVIPPAAPGASFAEAFAPFQSGGGLGQGASAINAASGVAAPAMSAVGPVTGGLAQPLVATAPVPSSGDFLSQLFSNPMQSFGLMQGLGRGLSAAEDAKERQAEIERREANYSDTSGLFRLSGEQGAALPDAASVYNSRIYGKSKLAYDPKTGRILAGA